MLNVQEDEQETKSGFPIIFRNDDVNPNTDFVELEKIYENIIEFFPEARIIQAVTLFSHSKGIDGDGSVYQREAPFKDNPKAWFYEVNKGRMNFPSFKNCEWASHGLVHADHSVLSWDAQEMSIVTSCRLLGTNVFIPPFVRYNKDTVDICRKHGIKLIGTKNWKSLEYEIFNPEHRLWYFHSWRWTAKEFRKRAVRLPEIQQSQLTATGTL